MSCQLADLREILEDTDDEQDLSQPPAPSTVGAFSTGQGILFGPATSYIHGRTGVALPALSKETRNALHSLYRQRVDCLYKILHWPTVLADVRRLHDNALDACKSTSIIALELSICFMAMCSITQCEAEELGLGDRDCLVEQYRDATEKAISQADLFRQPTVPVLQALVIYLVVPSPVPSAHLAKDG